MRRILRALADRRFSDRLSKRLQVRAAAEAMVWGRDAVVLLS